MKEKDGTESEFETDLVLLAMGFAGPSRNKILEDLDIERDERGNIKIDGHGAMFKGTKGFIVADFGSRIIIPYGKGADLSYYKPRTPETLIPSMGGFQAQWLNAAKSSNPANTSCNFDYGGKMIETMLLGLVAFRVGEKINYDGKTGKTGNAKADAFISKEYRKGWTLDG